MGNELCVASGGCPNKVLKDPPVSQRGPPQVFLSHRWTFSWSTTLRSHFCWTSTKIARGTVITRVGRWATLKSSFPALTMSVHYKFHSFADQVWKNRGRTGTSWGTSSILERNFFSLGQGRGSSCALWKGEMSILWKK